MTTEIVSRFCALVIGVFWSLWFCSVFRKTTINRGILEIIIFSAISIASAFGRYCWSLTIWRRLRRPFSRIKWLSSIPRSYLFHKESIPNSPRILYIRCNGVLLEMRVLFSVIYQTYSNGEINFFLLHILWNIPTMIFASTVICTFSFEKYSMLSEIHLSRLFSDLVLNQC